MAGPKATPRRKASVFQAKESCEATMAPIPVPSGVGGSTPGNATISDTPFDSALVRAEREPSESGSQAPEQAPVKFDSPIKFPSEEHTTSQEHTNGTMSSPDSTSNLECGPVPREAECPRKRPHSEEPADSSAPTLKRTKGLPQTPIKSSAPPSPRFPSPPGESASPKDKEKWQGWCVIESDPAYISAMMRLMGVQGVSVRQVFAVDELKLLTQPIYGLILLYRYRAPDENGKQDRGIPDNVWFANQLPAQNSCATLAMFNILMNARGVTLGENLDQFKDFTAPFTPYLRGEAFASFQFVKKIHNSFAKKMDMLEDDAHLSNKVKRSKAAGRRGSKDSNASDESLEDNAHHFIAFVPINGRVWKLDGLDYQPVDVGKYDPANPDAWLNPASDRIMQLMAAAGDQDYSLLSVIQSPVVGLRSQLCKSYAEIRYIETRLDSTQDDWRSFLVTGTNDQAPAPGTPGLLSAQGVTQEQLAAVEVQDDFMKGLESADLETLLTRRAALIADQQGIESEIFTEMDTEAGEDSKARERQWDYGPVVQKWLEMLAKNGYLEANINRHKSK